MYVTVVAAGVGKVFGKLEKGVLAITSPGGTGGIGAPPEPVSLGVRPFVMYMLKAAAGFGAAPL